MKTKKLPIFAILSFAALSIGNVSCKDDLLDTVPNDRVRSEIYWTNDNDAKMATNAIYSKLDSAVRLIKYDAFSDIGHVNEFFTPLALVEQNRYDNSSAIILEEWRHAYTTIQQANFVLDNIGKIPVTTTNEKILKQYNGEAMALRAYQYIKLASLFGDAPLVTKTITREEAAILTRTPVSQIWDFVHKELTDAAEMLPVTYDATNKGRMTKGAAFALDARANLYAGRMQQAADAAQKVISLGVYGIYPQYSKLFSYSAENNIEVILDKQYVKDVYPTTYFGNMAPYSQTGTTTPSPNMFVPTRAIVDMYPMANGMDITDPASGYDEANPYANRDPRLSYSIYVPGDELPNGKIFNSVPNSNTADAIGSTFYATSTGFTIKKYVNKEDFTSRTNNGINTILMRYAEVLLTYAEAKIELNQIDNTVLKAINDVRQRGDVNLPAISTTDQAELREIVRKERTIELAFEGHRLLDIRRWKIAETVVPGKVFGLSYLSEGELKKVEVPSFLKAFDPSKDYVWPIPQIERTLNPNLSQNNNW
jgi:starch-binding outer membrane protein, SusD/RagB family